jgi:hypothetical protein
MLELRSSDRFKKEYTRFKKVVDTITVESARERGQQLLVQLQKLSALVERAHDAQHNPVVDPRSSRDIVIQMIEVRKELAQLVKDAGR